MSADTAARLLSNGNLAAWMSEISAAWRNWFIAGNTNFGDIHFLIKTLKKMWVKQIEMFFLHILEKKSFEIMELL